jgi:hypothetical protein
MQPNGNPNIQDGPMQKRTRRTLLIATAVALLGAASALAGPLKGATYSGYLPTSGTANFKHLTMKTHPYGGKILLYVSHNGHSVTVKFSNNHPFLYCRVEELLKVQSTKPATISSSGSFTATIGQKFKVEPGEPAITQKITGRFSGSHVSGTITTSAGECGGVAHFSATS